MKTDKFKPRIKIESDMPLSNEQYAIIRRVITVIQGRGMDVVSNIKAKEYERFL